MENKREKKRKNIILFYMYITELLKRIILFQLNGMKND